MGAPISQVQTPQGNQPVNPPPTQANYSPAQQQMSGQGPAPGYVPPPPALQPNRDTRFDQVNLVSPGLPSESSNSGMSFTDAQPANNMYGSGKGGRRVMYSPLSNQPTMGQPNPYPNTIGQWDNASIKPQPRQGGKGKGY